MQLVAESVSVPSVLQVAVALPVVPGAVEVMAVTAGLAVAVTVAEQVVPGDPGHVASWVGQPGMQVSCV